MTNILYYGYNNKINDIIFEKFKTKYNINKINTHIYKQHKY